MDWTASIPSRQPIPLGFPTSVQLSPPLAFQSPPSRFIPPSCHTRIPSIKTPTPWSVQSHVRDLHPSITHLRLFHTDAGEMYGIWLTRTSSVCASLDGSGVLIPIGPVWCIIGHSSCTTMAAHIDSHPSTSPHLRTTCTDKLDKWQP